MVSSFQLLLIFSSEFYNFINRSVIMIGRLLLRSRSFVHSRHIALPKNTNYDVDSYNSVHLSFTSQLTLPVFSEYFSNMLKAQIEGNKKAELDNETNSIWVHVEDANLTLAQYIISQGFTIHHGLGKKVSFYRWISSQKDLVPLYSTCFISAGAIIIKDNKILLVQERKGARKGNWGIPGGRTDFGQTISSCAQRQLFEETNVKAKFQYILHFRQLEKTAYGGMDIYFACVMKCQEQTLNNIKLCSRELNSYNWQPLQTYDSFMEKNSFGTQYQLSKYITHLYKQGYDFKNKKPNQTRIQNYVGSDKVNRTVAQHGLVEGFQIQKTYQN